MTPRLLDFLADPNDLGGLQLHVFEGTPDLIREGILLNPQTHRWFPIQDGIPSLFVDGLRPDDGAFLARWRERIEAVGGMVSETQAASVSTDFGRIESERRARDEQAEDYDQMISLKMLALWEVPAYRKALERESSQPILEAGCGTGRFTGLFSDLGGEVVAVDMSRDSLERNRVRHIGKTRANVHYVHADLTHLPLKDRSFDRVAHCGVYEHIPSRELRQQFVSHARRVLQPDGVLLLSAYRYQGLTRFFQKEGEHDGGIPFFRFTPEELQAEVAPFFDITRFRANLGIYMSMVVGTPKG